MEQIKRYQIYNKDSRLLSELPDNSVDYIITSPPFNIGHKYRNYEDSLCFDDFMIFYSTFIESFYRVLRNGGALLIDIADVIIMDQKIIFGAELIKDLARKSGLKYICTQPYVAIEGTDSYCGYIVNRFDESVRAHSTCEQVLYFGKRLLEKKAKEIQSINLKPYYEYTSLYDKAFWPEDLVADLTKPFNFKDKVLLDPFMGSGTVGKFAIEHGAFFIGYDIDGETIDNYEWEL